MRFQAALALSVLSIGCSAPSESTGQPAAPSSPGSPDGGQVTTPGADAGTPTRPLALVYRGPASCADGCSEAWAAMFKACQPGFDVAFVGPSETLSLTKAVFATAAVYVQPGGNANLNRV